MRRWHSPRERALMLRRWKQEMKLHGYDWRNPPQLSCNPEDQGIHGVCHCAAGIGSMRKRRPLDCGNPRCSLCHFDKFHLPKARAEKKRAAIEFELNAY